jgi:2-aminoadipate transaminase
LTIAAKDTNWNEELLASRAANLPAPLMPGGATARDLISFVYGLPDEESFPAAELAAATAAVMKEQAGRALQYGAPTPLTEYLLDYIKRDQKLELTPNNLLITAGSSQALGLVCRLLVEPGDYIVVEAPTFLGAVRTFQNHEANIEEVPLAEDGINVEALDAKLTELKAVGKRVKFIYTIPTFHNPTGVTLGLEGRQALLEVARRHQVLILEDDAYHGLVFEGQEPPWLWSLDKDDMVLHCGTFSKVLAAGMRLGWVGGPAAFIGKIATLKDDGGTNPFSGYTAAKFAENGQLEAHTKKLIDIYRKKRDRTLAGLERYMPDGARWTNPQGGFFIWLELPESLDTVKMLPKAIEAGVTYLPGPACFASRGGRNTIRLAFSFVKLDQIEPGLRILGEVIQKELGA